MEQVCVRGRDIYELQKDCLLLLEVSIHSCDAFIYALINKFEGSFGSSLTPILYYLFLFF